MDTHATHSGTLRRLVAALALCLAAGAIAAGAAAQQAPDRHPGAPQDHPAASDGSEQQPPPAQPGPQPAGPVQQAPDEKCRCATLDVKVKAVEFVDRSLAVLVVGARSREAWVKRYRVGFGWTLACTEGEPNDCRGNLDFGPPKLSPAGPVAGGAKKTVRCASKPLCAGNAGSFDGTLSIPVEYVKETGGTFTVAIPVTVDCEGKTAKTFELAFEDGKLDRFWSDLDGDGKTDKKKK